jgi:hypothetical protein
MNVLQHSSHLSIIINIAYIGWFVTVDNKEHNILFGLKCFNNVYGATTVDKNNILYLKKRTSP